MRLKIPMTSANEQLAFLINQGYGVLSQVEHDYSLKKMEGKYIEDVDNIRYSTLINEWAATVSTDMIAIFPTELEKNLFLHPVIPFGAVSGDYKYQSLILNFNYFIRGLENIRQVNLTQYTDLPIQHRLYVEDIDSFQKVRDVNPGMVSDLLKDGYLNLSEDQVQLDLERILNVSFHKKDWGGEANDLYTANVIVNGTRRSSAFLLKGPGIGRKEMTIADCGKNGDQIVRLFTTPADLFVVQYVGPISEMLVKDIQGKVEEVKTRGGTAHFLIIDGQDTARLLHAYGNI
jgi:hypothetical protein